MVPVAAIVLMALTVIVCIALPFGGAVLLLRRFGKVGRAFWCGMLAFFVSQVVLRIPLMTIVVPSLGDPAKSVLLSAPVASFSAGLFEETGRLVVMVLLMKAFHRLADGVAFGLGHGGLEAILLVGLVNLNNLVIAVMMNTGQWPALTKTLTPEVAAQIEKAMTQTPWWDFGLAGLERIGAIGLHIALSLVVLAGIVHGRKLLAWVVAVVVHGVVNLGVISAVQAEVPIAVVEFAYIAVVAILLIGVVRRLGPTFPTTVAVDAS